MNWLTELPIWIWTAIGIYLVMAVWFGYEMYHAPLMEE